MDAFEHELTNATDPVNGHLLGAVAFVIDNTGQFLYRRASGRQLLDSDILLSDDCTLSMHSAAKFVINVAALQLVERGLVTLDEPVNKHIPEIDELLVLDFEANDVKSYRPTGLHPPSRPITLRDLLLNTSGIGYDTYMTEKYGSGQGFIYGWSIYVVQLLVERLGGHTKFVQYADEHIFGQLGMTSSTYVPAQVPAVWDRRLQIVKRTKDNDGLQADDDATQGFTSSVSDLARLFGDLLAGDKCKRLQKSEHRDLLFAPQLEPGSDAHKSFLSDTTNFGFLLDLDPDVPNEVAWKEAIFKSTSTPALNWTVAGTLIEKDDALLGTGIPADTVTFEGLANVIWTMNRERGRLMLFGNQLLPSYGVRAHNLATLFLREAWKVFGGESE
ncbi:hypothetical protein SEUCBS139899_003797 [Sporothrix eucalyptigena]